MWYKLFVDVLINDFLYLYKVTFVCLRGQLSSNSGRGDKSAFKWEPCTLEEKEGLGVCHRENTSKMQILPKNKGN